MVNIEQENKEKTYDISKAVITTFRPQTKEFSIDNIVIEDIDHKDDEIYRKMEGQLQSVIEYFKFYDGLNYEVFPTEKKEHTNNGKTKLIVTVPKIKTEFKDLPPIVQIVVDIYADSNNVISSSNMEEAQQYINKLQEFMEYSIQTKANAQNTGMSLKNNNDKSPAALIKDQQKKGLTYQEYQETIVEQENNNENKKKFMKNIDNLFNKGQEARNKFESINDRAGINVFYLVDVTELRNVFDNCISGFNAVNLIYGKLAKDFYEEVGKPAQEFWNDETATQEKILFKTKQLPTALVSNMLLYTLKKE